MRIAFALLLALHGLIHLLGFVKGFHLAEINQLQQPVSKTAALLWLLATLLFLTAAGIWLSGSNAGWMVLLPAVVLSQLLIFNNWQDAKFGAIANVMAIIGLALGFGAWRFQNRVAQELRVFLATPAETKPVNNEELAKLPPAVQKWITVSGALDKPSNRLVHLKQRGQMRTQPDGAWMPFEAEQHFTITQPGFLWTTTMQAAPMISIVGRDKYENGRGNMRIELLSLFPLADASGPATDQGSMLRFLAETCWFPDAALQPYIQWESIDAQTARATMTWGGISGSGTFFFNESGDILRFEAKRYYDRKEGATLEDWQIINRDWKSINGYRIPVKSEVTWKLKDGDFHWLTLEIDSIGQLGD
jgi:hypothetical protein